MDEKSVAEARQGVAVEGRMVLEVHTPKISRLQDTLLKVLTARHCSDDVLGPPHGRAEKGILAGMV